MRRLRLPAFVLALVVMGCAPSGERTFELQFPGRDLVDPLAVTVVDRAGIVMAIGPGPDGAPHGVSSAPGGPNQLVVTWVGGMCDHRTTLIVGETSRGYRITEQTERADSCRLAAVSRSVALQLSGPVNIATVEFVSGTR